MWTTSSVQRNVAGVTHIIKAKAEEETACCVCYQKNNISSDGGKSCSYIFIFTVAMLQAEMQGNVTLSQIFFFGT